MKRTITAFTLGTLLATAMPAYSTDFSQGSGRGLGRNGGTRTIRVNNVCDSECTDAYGQLQQQIDQLQQRLESYEGATPSNEELEALREQFSALEEAVQDYNFTWDGALGDVNTVLTDIRSDYEAILEQQENEQPVRLGVETGFAWSLDSGLQYQLSGSLAFPGEGPVTHGLHIGYDWNMDPHGETERTSTTNTQQTTVGPYPITTTFETSRNTQNTTQGVARLDWVVGYPFPDSDFEVEGTLGARVFNDSSNRRSSQRVTDVIGAGGEPQVNTAEETGDWEQRTNIQGGLGLGARFIYAPEGFPVYAVFGVEGTTRVPLDAGQGLTVMLGAGFNYNIGARGGRE